MALCGPFDIARAQMLPKGGSSSSRTRKQLVCLNLFENLLTSAGSLVKDIMVVPSKFLNLIARRVA